MIWERRWLAVSVGADFRVPMDEYLRHAGLWFLLAAAKSKTKPGTHYICSRFDTVAQGGGGNGPDQCLPIPRSVIESSERATTVVSDKLSRKSRLKWDIPDQGEMHDEGNKE
jgi:hypothetical protein